MGKTRSKEIVKQEFYSLLNEYGFSVVEDTYETAHSKIKCADSDGYLYSVYQNGFIYNQSASKWRANPYVEYNFDIFMNSKFPNLKRLSNNTGNSNKIKYIDSDGFLYSIKPNSVLSSNRIPSAWHKNPYILENISNWLLLNQPSQKLKSGQLFNSMKTKMAFICDEHGEYEQSFFDKKYGKSNCKECSKKSYLNNGFYIEKIAERNKEKWENIDAVLYIIELYNENEKFYKVGITKKYNIDKRFSAIPYCVNVIQLFNLNLYDCVHVEKYIHDKLNDYNYEPKIKFDGYRECFSKI